ncbi:hypothetical protein [Lactococcus sp. DD01]|uniref:hypothetical protein n=1 Tax=Lactococcus sp. DD01 TaxID=1776443 RepID=UPI0007761969|nr:hypothetical protein [Lactococcus sp. DD01]KXT63152.1 hypothetical protein LACDD01_00179 [Lactococcus sp. DD01]
MAVTIDKAIDILVSRQDKQATLERQRQLQRRNTVTDSKSDFKTMLRGTDKLYTAFRITNDLQYIMKYSFNLHIRPFVTSFSQTAVTSNTSLAISDGKITPNPHNHNVAIGVEISEHNFDTSSLRISIQDVDITDALIAEYGDENGKVINGYGYFPSQDTNFDVMRIIDYLPTWQQSVLLSPGLKEIQISQDADSLCECEISYYIKYNHVDRGGTE